MIRFASLLALALVACIPVAPEPTPPAPEPVIVQPSCLEACARFAALGCEEARPTPGGASCAEVCENAQSSPAPLDLSCIVRSSSCAQARLCE